MSRNLRNLARTMCAVMLLSTGLSLMQPVCSANAKSQADVDAHKTSKDDNQSQTKSPVNAHKKGTPLPFEGPPARSGGANSTSSATDSGSDKKP